MKSQEKAIHAPAQTSGEVSHGSAFQGHVSGRPDEMTGLIGISEKMPGMLSPDAGQIFPSDGFVQTLSERERQVLEGIAEGLSNKQIGDRLHIARGTTKHYAHSLFAKLNVETREQAAAAVLRSEKENGAKNDVRTHTGGEPFEPLTQAEEAVLPLLKEGKSNEEIARILSLARGTVKNRVTSILAKYGAHKRIQIM